MDLPTLDAKLELLRRHRVAVYKELPTGEIAVEFDDTAYVAEPALVPPEPLPEEQRKQEEDARLKTMLRSAR
jgi:hypothetical protein